MLLDETPRASQPPPTPSPGVCGGVWVEWKKHFQSFLNSYEKINSYFLWVKGHRNIYFDENICNKELFESYKSLMLHESIENLFSYL